MSLFKRASRLLTADINHLRDSVSELRTEMVRAVARQKRLAKQKTATESLASELERKAVLALEHGNRELARKVLDQRLEALKAAETMGHELESATSLATRVKTDLVRMQGQVDIARGKQVGATR